MALVEGLQSDSSDSESDSSESDSDIDSEPVFKKITEHNIKLSQTQKQKPCIEVISSSKGTRNMCTAPESGDKTSDLSTTHSEATPIR